MSQVLPGVLGRGPPWACSSLCLGQRAREGWPGGHCHLPLEAPQAGGHLGLRPASWTLDFILGDLHTAPLSGTQGSRSLSGRAEGPVMAQRPSEQGLSPKYPPDSRACVVEKGVLMVGPRAMSIGETDPLEQETRD